MGASWQHRFSDRQLVLLVVATGLLAHFYFFLVSSEHYLYDSKEYLAAMRSLVVQHQFLDAAGQVEVRRTPGYPLFLIPFALLRASIAQTVAVQHLLAVALAVVVQMVAWRASGSRAAGLLAGLVAALDPSLIFAANVIMTETLASAMLVALAILLAREKGVPSPLRIGLAGVVCGAAYLIRPIMAYLWIPLALLLLFQRRMDEERVWMRIRRVGVFVLAALLLPTAWSYRNRMRTGSAAVSSIALEDLYYWRAASAEATAQTGFVYALLPDSNAEDAYKSLFIRTVQRDYSRRLEVEVRAVARQRGRALSVRERDQVEAAMAWRIILGHPWATFLMTLNGALHFVFDSAWMFASQVAGSLLRPPLLYLQSLLSIVELPLAMVGWFFLRRRAPRMASVIAIILVYFVAVGSGPEQEQWRYRIPVIPLYAVLVASGIEALRLKRMAPDRRTPVDA
jgi:4-amino-4-deoxy-L-arabinose transferase-like glycosyltransferase